MFEKINNYNQWNKALWTYFFSKGTEKTILYLDAHLIEEIGKCSHIEASDYKEDFLSKTLLNKEKVSYFVSDWRMRTGCPIRIVYNE